MCRLYFVLPVVTHKHCMVSKSKLSFQSRGIMLGWRGKIMNESRSLWWKKVFNFASNSVNVELPCFFFQMKLSSTLFAVMILGIISLSSANRIPPNPNTPWWIFRKDRLVGVDSLVLVCQKKDRGKTRSSSVVVRDFCSLPVRAHRCRIVSSSVHWKLISYRFLWALVRRQCCPFSWGL